MGFLTERQVKALKLSHEGKKVVQIAEQLGIRSSSASEAVKRGKRNVEKTIQTVETLLKEGIFTRAQISHLKTLLKEA